MIKMGTADTATLLKALAVLLLAAVVSVASITAAQTGQTLRVGSAVEPPTLDPQRDAGGPANEIQENIFETLVAFSQEMDLEPRLATGWQVSPDGKTYTFQLRRGVRFHDGTPFNAEAVKFTFDRVVGAVDGRQSRYVTLMTQLDSVEVVDESTVRFHLKNPFAPFLSNLAHLGHSILSPTAVRSRGEQFGRQPVGTGPFRLHEWRTGQQLTLRRNTDYWRAGVPRLDEIVVRYLPDSSTRIVALESGEIDVALYVPETDFNRLATDPRFTLYKADTLRTVFLMFNPQTFPFDDPAVRQAIAHAIDREGIATAILEGLHRPATRPTFAPGVWGVSDAVTPYRFDVEAANRILDQAGWRRGGDGIRAKDGRALSFTLYTTQNRYPQDREIGAFLRSELARSLGARVDLGTYEWDTYRDNIFAKRLGLFLFGAGVSTGDIDFVATILFHSSSRYTQGRFSVEDDIIQAQITVDAQRRLDLYHEIQEAIASQYIWIPLYWQSALHASSPRVVGFAAHPLEKVNFSNVSLR